MVKKVCLDEIKFKVTASVFG